MSDPSPHDSTPASGTRPPLSVPLLAVTFFGSGLFPFAPGTVGSAAATAVVVALDRAELLSWGLLLGMAIAASAINVALGPWIERAFGRKDPGAVVIDECAGQWLTFLPLAFVDPVPLWAFPAGFLLFRVFDITKPLGAKRLERLPHGWGVLMDDVLCGVYSAAILALLLRFVG